MTDRTDDLTLEDMSVHDGGIDMSVSGDRAQLFWTNLIKMFKQAGSKNFLTLTVSNKTEKYAITIQNCNGVDTPEEKIKRLTARAEQAERERDAAVADINAILRNGTDECRHFYCKRGNEVDGCGSDDCEDAEWRGPQETGKGEAK